MRKNKKMTVGGGLGFHATAAAGREGIRAPARRDRPATSRPTGGATRKEEGRDDGGGVRVPVPRSTLLAWNLSMAAFHAVLALTVLSVGRVDLSVPLYRTVLHVRDRAPGSGDAGSGDDDLVAWELVPSYEPSGSLAFTVLTACFFFLSATFHLLNATLLRDYYESELSLCRTPTRWVEYSLSAPLMIVLIAYGMGVRDDATILCLAALVHVTMPFGYWVEVASRPSSLTTWSAPLRARIYPWLLGHVPQTVAWFVVVRQLYGASPSSPLTDDARRETSPPDFVYAVLWSQLLLFFSFGGASLLSQVGPPSRFCDGEIAFQCLSLLSKGLLGVLLLANVLVYSRIEDAYEDAAAPSSLPPPLL